MRHTHMHLHDKKFAVDKTTCKFPDAKKKRETQTKSTKFIHINIDPFYCCRHIFSCSVCCYVA